MNEHKESTPLDENEARVEKVGESTIGISEECVNIEAPVFSVMKDAQTYEIIGFRLSKDCDHRPAVESSGSTKASLSAAHR